MLADPSLVILRPIDGDSVGAEIHIEGTAFAPTGIGAVFVSTGPNTPAPAETSDGYRTWSARLPSGPGETFIQAELFDLTGERVAIADSGSPDRTYSYARPGFFVDEALEQRASLTVRVNGDDTHEKIRVELGDRLFIEDDVGAVFEIRVGDKPSAHTIELDVTRVR